MSVYLGPTIVGVIQKGTIYTCTREEAIKSLADVIEKYPLVKRLIVNSDTLTEDITRVKTRGNALNDAYHRLARSAKKRF